MPSIAHAVQPLADADEHDAAVKMARSGEPALALQRLRALHAKRPDDAQILIDAVIVASWAGDNAAAVALMRESRLASRDADALEAAARSARNLHDYDAANGWIDATLRVAPGRLSARVTRAMLLAESDYIPAANLAIGELLAAYPQEISVVLAAAYVKQRSGEKFDALALYQRAKAMKPDSIEAAAGVRVALGNVGAAHAALEQKPAAGNAETERLRTDTVAEAIRYGTVEQANPHDRFGEAREALVKVDENLANLPKDNPVQRTRARIDRLHALRSVEEMQAILDDAAALEHDKIELPVHAQVPVADAQLYLRHPSKAIELYENVLKANPDQPEVEFSLMYAQLEAEHFGAARATLDRLLDRHKPWLYAPGLVRPEPNLIRARADITLALLLSFGDDLAGAQTHLESLIAEAPARAELHRELATVYLRRGWTSRALEEYRIASSIDNDDLGSKIGLVNVSRNLNEYKKVESALVALETAEPANLHVQSARDEWDAVRGWQFDISDRRGRGDSQVFGNRDRDEEATLQTPLINGAWRIYAQQRKQTAEIPEGDVEYRRAGLGVRYTENQLDLRAAVLPAQDSFADRDSFNVSARWRFNDTWWSAAEFDTATAEAPLRARFYGITATAATLAAGWQRDDLLDAQVRASYLDFTDGNERESVSAQLRQRALTTPHVKIDARFELGASHNSLDGVPYFNPSRDVIGTAGLTLDWLTWRRYENNFHQRFGVAAGQYWQQGFGTSDVLRASAEHEWQFGPHFSFLYGLGWFRQSYDGREEIRREWFAALHWGGLSW